MATVRSSNANGTSVDYAWDAANQLTSVTDNRLGGVTTAAYTPTGRPADPRATQRRVRDATPTTLWTA